MGDSKIEQDSTEVGNLHQGEVGGLRKLQDGNENFKKKTKKKQKTIGLISKTTTLHVHHTLLCISCRFCTTTTSKCLI